MKLRIKGNTLRIRVSKSEVHQLETLGYVEERINFGNSALHYRLQVANETSQLSASFTGNQIIMNIPSTLITNWASNDIVGFEANQATGEGDTGSLYLLLEKDFVCIDATNEDQSDNYENPNKAC